MKIKEVPGGFFITVDRGEELVATLTQFATERAIPAGAIAGIGAIEEVTLGYFDCATQEYDRRTFAGEYELISMNGNVSQVDGAPFVHLHCALGKPDFSVIGGHLFSATVAVTTEIELRVFDSPMVRAKDEHTGLNLLDLGTGG